MNILQIRDASHVPLKRTVGSTNLLNRLDGLKSLLRWNGPAKVASRTQMYLRRKQDLTNLVFSLFGLRVRWRGGKEEKFSIMKNKTLSALIHTIVPTPHSKKVGDPISPGALSRALYLTIAYLEAIRDTFPQVLGTGSYGYQLTRDQLLDLFYKSILWPEDKFKKYAKYILSSPISSYLGNDLPERPVGFQGSPLGWGGPVKRFLKSRLKTKNLRCRSLFCTILLGIKRACDSLTDDEVERTAWKWKEEVSTPFPSYQEIQPDPRHFLELEVKSCIKNIISNLPKVRVGSLCKMSSSASYTNKRSDGGARHGLLSVLYGSVSNRPDLPRYYLGLLDPPLQYMVFYPFKGVLEAHHYDEPEIDPYSDYFYTQEMCLRRKILRFEISQGLIPRDILIAEYLSELKHDDSFHIFRATPSFLKEPLKIRTITKEEEIPTWLGKPIQKAMWRMLQAHPAFVLTGRPGEVHDRELIWNAVSQGQEEDRFWISGDYSAATDNMNPRVSRYAVEQVFNHLGLHTPKDKFVLGLMNERRIIPPPRLRDLGEFYTRRGQLMGNILSFPILCLVNLATWMVAYKRFYGEVPPPGGCLVNGDDILFAGHVGLREEWRKIAEVCGFNLSLGKNYIHKSFSMINSQPCWGRELIQRIPACNIGLMTRQNRKTGREVAKEASCPDCISECVERSFSPDRTYNRCLYYWKKDLSEMSNKGLLSYNLPRCLGGLGVRYSKGYYTKFQIAFANFLFRKQQKSLRQGGSLISLYEQVKEIHPTPRNWLMGGETYNPLELSQFDAAIEPEVLSGPPSYWSRGDGDSLEKYFLSSKLRREFNNSGPWDLDMTRLYVDYSINNIEQDYRPLKFIEDPRDYFSEEPMGVHGIKLPKTVLDSSSEMNRVFRDFDHKFSVLSSLCSGDCKIDCSL